MYTSTNEEKMNVRSKGEGGAEGSNAPISSIKTSTAASGMHSKVPGQQVKVLRTVYPRMNHLVLMISALLAYAVTKHSIAAQPLCGNEKDIYTNKLCLTVLEELLRRNHHQQIEQPYDYPAELYENTPFENRGSKRQDVDHVFLRFGR